MKLWEIFSGEVDYIRAMMMPCGVISNSVFVVLLLFSVTELTEIIIHQLIFYQCISQHISSLLAYFFD